MILIINTLINFLASFIEIFLIYNIMQIVFPIRLSFERLTYVKIIFSALFSTIIFIFNSTSFFSYYTILFAAIYAIITGFILFKANIINLLSVSSFYFLCLSTMDFLIITIADNIDNRIPDMLMDIINKRGIERIVFIIAMKTLWIAFYCLISYFLKKNNKNGKHVYYLFPLSYIGFICFFDLVRNTMMTYNIDIPLSWIIFVLSFCLIITCFYLYSKNKKEQLLLLHNTLLEENYQSLSNIYASNRTLFHDLNNHFNILHNFLSKNDAKSALIYLNKIYLPIKNLSKAVWTGIDVIDVIINSKLTLAKEHNIHVDINVEFPSNTGIEPHDICIILSNLLDNAVEACLNMEESGQKKIQFTMRHINSFLIIKIINPYTSAPKIVNEFISTTKQDKLLHGWGLKSANTAINKYNGTLNYEINNKDFITKAILFFEITT